MGLTDQQLLDTLRSLLHNPGYQRVMQWKDEMITAVRASLESESNPRLQYPDLCRLLGRLDVLKMDWLGETISDVEQELKTKQRKEQ